MLARVQVLKRVTLLAVVASLLVACGGTESTDDDAADSQDVDTEDDAQEGGSTEATATGDSEPLQVGVLTGQTGPYETIGAEVVEVAEFAVEDVNANGGINGRPVELTIHDSELNPEVALTELDRMVKEEGVDVVIGTISSAVSLAVQDRTETMDFVMMNTISRSPQLTGEACNPYAFRVNKNDLMDGAVIEAWLEANPDMLDRTWATLGYDYEWGHTHTGEFRRLLQEAGGNLSDAELFTPLDTQDFSPIVTSLQQSGADAVWTAMVGPGFVALKQQADQFGLDILWGGGAHMATSNIKALGEAADGMVGIVNYDATLDTPANQEFVDAFETATGELPGNFNGETYAGFQAVFQAVEAADSIEAADIAAELAGMEFESVFGPAQFRPEDNQAELPGYAGHVEVTDGVPEVVVDVEVDAETTGGDPTPGCSLE